MSKILHIETATDVCSVVISEDEKILVKKEMKEGRSHATSLAVFIHEAFAETGISASALDAVSISMGPGSYTGLRIGVSTAKGICYGSDKPLIAISTLESMAAGMIASLREKDGLSADARYLPMIDARRMEVYTAVYDEQLHLYEKISAKIIEEDSFTDIANKYPLLLFGSGADKLQDVLKIDNISIIPGFKMSATYMITLAMDKFQKSEFEDVAYFEPYYLKDFITTTPKKKFF